MKQIPKFHNILIFWAPLIITKVYVFVFALVPVHTLAIWSSTHMQTCSWIRICICIYVYVFALAAAHTLVIWSSTHMQMSVTRRAGRAPIASSPICSPSHPLAYSGSNCAQTTLTFRHTISVQKCWLLNIAKVHTRALIAISDLIDCSVHRVK